MAGSVVGDLHFRIGASTAAMGRGFSRAEAQVKTFGSRMQKYFNKGEGLASVFAIPHPMVVALRALGRLMRNLARWAKEFIHWFRQIDVKKALGEGQISRVQAGSIQLGQAALTKLFAAFERVALALAAHVGPRLAMFAAALEPAIKRLTMINFLLTEMEVVFVSFMAAMKAMIEAIILPARAPALLAAGGPNAVTKEFERIVREMENAFKGLPGDAWRLAMEGLKAAAENLPLGGGAAMKAVGGVGAVTRGTTAAFSASQAAARQRDQIEKQQLHVQRQIARGVQNIANAQKANQIGVDGL